MACFRKYIKTFYRWNYYVFHWELVAPAIQMNGRGSGGVCMLKGGSDCWWLVNGLGVELKFGNSGAAAAVLRNAMESHSMPTPCCPSPVWLQFLHSSWSVQVDGNRKQSRRGCSCFTVPGMYLIISRNAKRSELGQDYRIKPSFLLPLHPII